MLNPTTLDEINFWDLEMFADGDPHAAWTMLRNQAPIWYHDKPGGEAFWCITKYADVRKVHSDAVLFSSERDGIMLRNDEMLAGPSMDSMLEMPPMIHTDPPRHAKLRKIISHNFTPKSIGKLEEQLRGFAVDSIERALEMGEIDFVTDIAHRIPAAITFALMDVPREDWDRLADLEHQTVTASDPEFQAKADSHDSAGSASMELAMYFAGLLTERAEDLGEDLLSQYLRGEIDGEPLPLSQVVAEAILLLAGGLDTTRAAASAGAMLPLLSHPDQLAALQEDHGRIPQAIEEMVRWATPIVSETRTVIRDTDFNGVRFAEGDRVTMWGPSANRDEDQFEDPFRYDTARTPNRHIGFAYGEHFCLGAHLARLTLRVEFEELFSRVGTFEQTGDANRVYSNFVGGLKHLPMSITGK